MTFNEWIRSFPWLHQRKVPCIVSADLDGIACGLLQQDALGWKVVGTYDGTTLSLYEDPGKLGVEIAFVDVEILRPQVRSIGNHLLALDSADIQHLIRQYPNCANPNLWRGINVRESFQRKYPFSTLPLLLASHVVRDERFEIARPWLALTLHTDSSFTNAATYQANALDWLQCMGQGASAGLAKFCKMLARITAQQALSLLHEVQQWAGDAGFGAKQRACRFDCSIAHERERVGRVIDRIRREASIISDLPFRDPPLICEKYQVRKLPLDSKGRQIASFTEARSCMAISMAATARNAEGLSITLPEKSTALKILR